MTSKKRKWQSAAILSSLYALVASTCPAQVPRYEPSKPTVSPYLNLFRDESSAVPNYQSLVRPLQRQYEVNQAQQRQLGQQSEIVQRLEFNVEELQTEPLTGTLVAPTGTGSWFSRPSTRSSFMNTSRYYSRSGSLLNPGGQSGPRRPVGR